MGEISRRQVREAAAQALRRRGYEVADVSKGQGVERVSRLRVRGNGEDFTCLIKTATGAGRISFPLFEDGRFLPLQEYDRVLHAWLLAGTAGTVKLSLFDQSVVLEAFRKCQEQMVAKGMGHLPCWVSPSYESGWRFAGSGYERSAIWTEAVDLTPEGEPYCEPAPEPPGGPKAQEEEGPSLGVNEPTTEPFGIERTVGSLDLQEEKRLFLDRIASLMNIPPESVTLELTISL